MKNFIAIVLILAAITVILTACGSSTNIKLPKFADERGYYYFPKPEEPDFLYTIDRWQLSNHERILLASMQGITAKDKP